MMNTNEPTTQSPSQIVYTTETWPARATAFAARTLHAVSLGAGVFLVLRVGLGRWEPGVATSAVLAVMAMLGAALLVGPAVARWYETRGTWELDGEGIAFVPLEGRRRFVRWSQVRSGRTRRNRIRLVSPRDSVFVDGGLLDRSTWARLRHDINTRTGDRVVFETGPTGANQVPDWVPGWFCRLYEMPRLVTLTRAAVLAKLLLVAALINASSGAGWPVGAMVFVIGLRVAMPLVNRLTDRLATSDRPESPGDTACHAQSE